MLFKGKIDKIDLDYISHKPKITIQLHSQYDLLSEDFNKLQQLQEIDIELKEHKEKRSLNSNSYAWVLITKIADVLRANKEDVYLEMLKRYGQSEIVSVLSSIDITGYFKYYEVAGTSTLNNKEFTHYKCFKGSSEYDTREMSILVDGIVSEAKLLNIETLTKEELENLKNSWKV
jgi:nitrogen regulatory protein PII-like uncharacterized protein